MQVLRTSVFSRSRRFVRDRRRLIQPDAWRTIQQHAKRKLPARRSGPRRILSIVLLATGTTLCSYVAGNYAWMYAAQKKLLSQWKSEAAAPATAPSLTKISIPRIRLRAIVLEGTSSHSLLLGPAHMTGTALPGAVGNAVIAGHRDTFFRNIHSLHTGDLVYILRAGTTFRYVVTKKMVVQPTATYVLRPTPDSELTLITCYPTYVIGPAPERLIIVARLSSATTRHSPSR
jgi:sortase A